MSNYWGIKLEDSYANDALTGGATPDVYIRTESHNPALNDEPQLLNLGSMAPQKDRVGYAEPSGDASTSADVKVFPWYAYLLLGNYRFTEDGYTEGSITKNVHEFWGGEKRNLPSATCAWAQEKFELITKGTILSSFKMTIGKELTTVEPSIVYSKDRKKPIDIDEYDANLIDSIPLIGYDWTAKIGNADALLSEAEIEWDNNINTDHCSVLGSRFYKRRPKADKRETTISGTSLLDDDNLQLVFKAMDGDYDIQADGYNYPTECKLYHDSVELKAQTCEESNEYIFIKFPWCEIQVEPLEAQEGGTEVNYKLTPLMNHSITLKDGSTRKNTDVYIQVVNDQDSLTE